MRSYTSLALGFVCLVAAGACGSAEDAAPQGPPDFSGPPPTGAPAQPSGPAQTPDPTNASPEMPAAVDPAAPPAGSNEANPDVSGLTPSEPPPSAGGDEGTETPATPEGETPPTETEPPVEPEPPAPVGETQVFLLFGQSNMWGVPATQPEDLVINPRVEVLTLEACNRHGANQWMPAQPSLHACVGQPGNSPSGPGLGPGDYFGRTLADAFPNDTILLVPNAIPGVSIDVFQPGQQAYNSIVTRARMAQERGEIRGMIFHQGETDCNQSNWPSRVKTVVDRLRSDLGIGDVPFLAGEMLYTNQGGQCGDSMNAIIADLPGVITNAFVVSAEGLGLSPDQYNVHFNLTGQREFGRRYGQVMLDALQP